MSENQCPFCGRELVEKTYLSGQWLECPGTLLNSCDGWDYDGPFRRRK